MERDGVIALIQGAFATAEFPGPFLRGSNEGCEPAEECDPFQAYPDWRSAPAEFLDQHGGALSFFSEAGFRFFLPAFLIADLEEKLQYADPLFHLTHGFYDFTVREKVGDREVVMHQGGSAFLNPRRYGAMTNQDYARFRFSVFTREEAAAIVAYLAFKRALHAGDAITTGPIDRALEGFWSDRAKSAPPATALTAQMQAQVAYLEAVRKKYGG